MELKVKLSDGAPLPKHVHAGDAGLDLTSRKTVELLPGETKTVGTGVTAAIPEGHVGLVFPRSGLGSRGVTLSNCVGVIDSGYRGEIMAPLHNNHPSVVSASNLAANARYNGDGKMTVERGDRVAQLVVVPYRMCECVEVDELGDTEREFFETACQGCERLGGDGGPTLDELKAERDQWRDAYGDSERMRLELVKDLEHARKWNDAWRDLVHRYEGLCDGLLDERDAMRGDAS